MLILKLFLLLLKLHSNFFSTKDKTPYFLNTFLVYKFVCARHNSCYIGKTCHPFKTRINQHEKQNKKSIVYKNLHNNQVLIQTVRLCSNEVPN